jgi:hypothetical protein
MAEGGPRNGASSHNLSRARHAQYCAEQRPPKAAVARPLQLAARHACARLGHALQPPASDGARGRFQLGPRRIGCCWHGGWQLLRGTLLQEHLN